MFLAQLRLSSSPAELALVLCMSAWGGPVCGFLDASAHAQVFCLSYLAHAIRKDDCVQECVVVCVCLHHSGCLLISICSVMTELHSKCSAGSRFKQWFFEQESNGPNSGVNSGVIASAGWKRLSLNLTIGDFSDHFLTFYCTIRLTLHFVAALRHQHDGLLYL